MKRLLAMVLAVLMVVSLVACAGKKDPKNTTPSTTGPESDPSLKVETFEGDFVYKDWVGTLATNWDPLTYKTEDDSYPLDYTTSTLYDLWFNDELHPKDGKDPYEGFVVMPEMAAELPVDITEEVKASHPQFGIPESATEGYAYSIKLNPNACFADGKPITAETWVRSMELLLRPELNNYRAPDFYLRGDFKIAGAKAYNKQGSTAYNPLGMTTSEFIANGGDASTLFVDMKGFWNVSAADGTDYASVTDDTMVRDPAVEEGQPEDYVSGKYLYETYFAPGCPHEAYAGDYLCTGESFPDGIEYDGTVGVYATGDYELVVVLENAMSGFNLYINLGGWLVDPDLYESCLTEKDGVWTCNYNTSVETSNSYGPYKVSEYQKDKYMRFVRNDKWWGHTDGKHIYKDPVDGKIYPMYQTTEVYTQVVAEASTAKLMFMAGELMTYGLQADDFATLKNSDYAYVTPAETIFCLIMNGHLESIKTREAAADFDQKTTDLETMTVDSFRRAMALVYDKNLLCEVISPARTAGLGILGSTYVYDVENALYYRETDQAKKVLCDFYSVDPADYPTLDDAVASITGYNPEGAKELFKQAFKDALEAGYITDENNDGISDQTVTMEYCVSAVDDFQSSLVDFLNQKANEVAVGTPFEGKILVKISPAYGNEWSDMIQNGLSDMVLGGFGGSNLNPFATMGSYLDPSSSFDGKWNDTSKIPMTLTIGGEEITMSVLDWCNCVNGTTITVDGKEYNFGDGQAEMDDRLEILAALEGAIMRTYNYIPMIQNQGTTLLSQQVYYVIDDFNAIMKRGGIAYMKYEYNEEEWAKYVADQGGELKY